jgi:hypothetical protein
VVESLTTDQVPTNQKGRIMGNVIGIGIVIMSVLAWFNHIFTCFAEGMWGFLIAGAIFFPIGIFHGMWLWIR